MKALTLRTPWGWAVCHGKPIENREWQPTPSQLAPGERFGIHAGKLAPIGEIHAAFAWMIELGLVKQSDVPTLEVLRRQSSAVVAVATFGGAKLSHPSPWFVGRFGWVLDDVVTLAKPVRCPGAQGLWTMPRDVERLVLDQAGVVTP